MHQPYNYNLWYRNIVWTITWSFIWFIRGSSPGISYAILLQMIYGTGASISNADVLQLQRNMELVYQRQQIPQKELDHFRELVVVFIIPPD